MPSHYIYNELTISGTTSIGVTGSVQAKHHVIGSNNSTIQLLGDLTTSISTAIISSRALFGASSNHDLGLITNGSERLTIKSTGEVGIGVTSPTTGTILHIKGVDSSPGTYSLLVQNSNNDSSFWIQNDRKIRLNGGSGDNEWVGIYQPVATSGNTNVFSVYTPAGGGTGRTFFISNNPAGPTRTVQFNDSGVEINYSFLTGESTISLNSNMGGVGFGSTSSPGPQIFSRLNSANRNHIQFINGSGGGLYMDQDPSTYYRLYMIGVAGSPTNWLLSSNADSWVAYTDTQNFGVGTNNPTTKLHIYATQSGGGFRLVDTTQGNGYILLSDANGVGSWTQSQAITVDSYFTMSAGGNFDWNIGLTSSNFKVELTSSVTVNLTNVINGDSGKMIVIQDGVGGHTLTPGTVNGVSVTHYVVGAGSGTLNLTGTSNSIDIVSFTFDGVNVYWNVDLDYT